MRILIVLAALLTMITIDAAAAAPYKWCAYYTNGGTNCGFPTHWACQASVSGAGGLCSINPRWTAAPEPRPYRKRNRHDRRW